MELCLVHTADFHGRLTREKAARLRELADLRGALLLDCGDAISAPNVVAYPWPEPTLLRMNEAGYDAMAMGNREYAWYRQGLLAKTAPASFPVLSANLRPRRPLPGRICPWTTVTAPDGRRVGVLGLTEPMVRPESMLRSIAAAVFTDPLEAAREAVRALRQEADLIVALTHYGRGDEPKLAEALPDIAVILCGHRHVEAPSLETVGPVAVARTYHHARGAAVVTLKGGRWTQEAYPL